MDSLVIGISLGLLGGVHCITMCGPIAAYLHHSSNTKFSTLFYNLGRLATYMLLGLVVGAIGEQLSVFGYQQIVSITSGSIIVLFVLVPQLTKFTGSKGLANHTVLFLRNKLLKITKIKSTGAYFGLGMLNGMLPCGLVYVALMASFNASNTISSILLMLGFGLGTWPLMFIIMTVGSKVIQQVRMKKLVPTLSIVIGIFLIMRGMSLDIPYLSPMVTAFGWDAGITTCN